MNETKSLFKKYKLITGWIPEHKEFYNNIPTGENWNWLRSDVIRFEYLSRCENVLYLDWDVKVNFLPKLNRITWASEYDYWAIYNGYEINKIKYIIDESVKVNRKKVKRNWLLPYIKDVGGKVFPIECMEHLGYKNA